MSLRFLGRRTTHSKIPPLEGSLADFARPEGPHLLHRTRSFFEWQSARREQRVWPYSRSLESPPLATTRVRYEEGVGGNGINFATQDYLSLSTHEQVVAAATRAIHDFGVHAGGAPMTLGSSRLSTLLERELAELLAMEHAIVFPSGWAAAFGAITGLVRQYDHVVLDLHAGQVLQEASEAATRNVLRHEHNDIDDVARQLADVRSKDTKNAILVATQSTFTLDGDSPNLLALQEICNAYEATLLVDVTHDLGATGPGGTGQLGIQSMMSSVDLVIGSFSKTFASNGGFLATRAREVKEFVKYQSGAHAASTALSPLQAAVAHEALSISRGREGDGLRNRLQAAVLTLRDELRGIDLEVRGDPSICATIAVGSEAVARQASWLAFQRGCIVNLVEHPVVDREQAVFQMHCQAAHTPLQIFEAADLVGAAIREAACGTQLGMVSRE